MMKTIEIGKKEIGLGKPIFIIFEASSTYSNFEEAKKMTKYAAEAGADAIKFQNLFPRDSERILGKKDLKVDFSTPTGKKQELMYDAIHRRELTKEQWIELGNYSKELGLMFVATPYFFEAVDLIKDMKTDLIKINKGDINNVLLIDEISKKNLPILLDGREKFSDIEEAIKICEKNGNKKLVIMHCPSGYPAEHAGVHLSAITSIKEKCDYPIGFADHSLGDIMNFAAIGLGACVIEKTITLDKKTELSEHYMSLEPHELKPFVENIRAIESALGDPNILNSSRVNQNLRRCFVAKNDIKKDEIISLESIDFQRPGDLGISCSEGFKILGKKAKTDIPKNTFLQWDMLT